MVCKILIVRDHIDFMLFLCQFEYTDEKSGVANPGHWLFIPKMVPVHEITVKNSMSRLLLWKSTDFE